MCLQVYGRRLHYDSERLELRHIWHGYPRVTDLRAHHQRVRHQHVLTSSIHVGANLFDMSGRWTHSRIQCQLPAGQGINLPVVVSAGDQSSQSTASFSYDPPSINGGGISPLSGKVLPARTELVGGSESVFCCCLSCRPCDGTRCSGSTAGGTPVTITGSNFGSLSVCPSSL